MSNKNKSKNKSAVPATAETDPNEVQYEQAEAGFREETKVDAAAGTIEQVPVENYADPEPKPEEKPELEQDPPPVGDPAIYEKLMAERNPEEVIEEVKAHIESAEAAAAAGSGSGGSGGSGSAGGSSRSIRSGSKPRPNVTYELLERPAAWSSTPQIAQIEQILFNNQLGEGGGCLTKMTEPELFKLLEDGKSSGALRTTQPAVRVFQYYRNDLRMRDTIAWK